MEQIIIHVDMDAFYASVEIRDDPKLSGKPLIIGSLPSERGVVATCSYEARKFGVHSAMNIKEAYRLCPNGIYMHPNFEKYKTVSNQLHEIWNRYASTSETIALDEAYLDVTDTAGNFEKARKIASIIKQRTKDELGLTCSVGLAYSKTAAKTASEEKKPNGYFEILTPQDFVNLIIDRNVRVLYTVGGKTAEKLENIGIHTVRQLLDKKDDVINLLGKQGKILTEMASGTDNRKVIPYRPENAKSISREVTFQEDVSDYELLTDILLLLSFCVNNRAKRYGLHGGGVVLKLTYPNMKSITRSKTVLSADSPFFIYKEAVNMLSALPKRPVRLIGTGIYNISGEKGRQLSLYDISDDEKDIREKFIKEELEKLHHRYNLDFVNNLEKIYHGEILHKTIEYMRKHKN
ncbi:MAG: DNA polymerase IV [Firmicutes bacterium]|nr:DNA polymerase IV [Bacillota bacterium]